MVKIMDIPNPEGRGSFGEAYRACAEENSPTKMRDVRAECVYPFSFFDLGFAKLPVDPRS